MAQTQPTHHSCFVFSVFVFFDFLCHLPNAAFGAVASSTLLGDHRTACPRSGVPRSCGCALERAAARICREAGTRVTTNTLVIDFNIPNVNRVDNRRIEVIANGLPIPPSHTPLTFLGQLKTVKAHLETGQYKNSPSKTTTKCISQPICWLESRRLPKAVLFL